MTTTSTSTSTSATGAPLVINGLVSGIDTTSVISALLQGYQAPITDLENQQTGLNEKSADYQTINSDLQALMNAAQSLSTNSSWDLTTGASSNSAVATVSAAPGAQTGSATFTVDQLAQGNVVVSQGGVSSTGATVTSASTLLVATGGDAIGFSGFANGGLAIGSHTVEVSQSSTAATITGSTELGAATSVTSSNNTLNVTVGTTAYSLTIAPPSSGTTYSASQLVSAINAAATTAGAGLTASLSSTGQLQLASNEQGSNAALAVTGGSALSTLGLSAGSSASGTDAVVSVDGTATTLSAINPGEQISLPTASGSLTATVASAPGLNGSLLSAGSASAQVVSTGNGSLSDVVSAINGSGLGLTASSVKDAQGSYRLQVSANSTGLAGSAAIDTSAFSGGALGTISEITAAQDALVSVGGTGGYQLSSSTDAFTSIIQGSTVTAVSTGTATVTIAPDASGEAGKVNSLVTAANQALSDIQSFAGYNASTKTGGPLMGSAQLNNLQQQIQSLFATAGGSSGEGNSLVAGVALTSSGTITFNSTTFESAYSADPAKIAAIFTQGGTFAASNPANAGDVSLVYAGNATQSGAYDVTVTQSATQATDSGATLSGGTVSSAETLTIAQGGTNATYTTTAGESLSAIAAGLNQQFSNTSVGVSATVVNGTQLVLTSTAYGSAAGFDVTSSATGAGTTGLGGATANIATSFSGLDVAGTINGVAATGTGQVLKAPLADPTLAGLALQVTTPGITTSTDLGSFTYSPGLAQQLQTLASTASDPATGTITTTINGLTSQAQGLVSQINNYSEMETKQQTMLQNEFATMEQTLGSLKNESSQLTSAINGLAVL